MRAELTVRDALVRTRAINVLRAVANADDLGVPLANDPRPVRLEVRHGAIRHCLEFGGAKGQHRPDKKLLAKQSAPASGCPGD